MQSDTHMAFLYQANDSAKCTVKSITPPIKQTVVACLTHYELSQSIMTLEQSPQFKLLEKNVKLSKNKTGEKCETFQKQDWLKQPCSSALPGLNTLRKPYLKISI